MRERVVTIEDAAELRLQQPHVVRLESRPAGLEGRGAVTIRDLVRNALRMRPDRIVVGEVRGGEALDMLSALTTGHEGSLTTVHAGSPEEALRRIETLALMADVALPHTAVRELLAGALDLVVHQARDATGARRVVAISEVVRVAGGVATRELFARRDGELRALRRSRARAGGPARARDGARRWARGGARRARRLGGTGGARGRAGRRGARSARSCRWRGPGARAARRRRRSGGGSPCSARRRCARADG